MQHRAHDLAGGARGQDVDDARRHAGFLEDRHQRQHGERRVGGGLEHHRAAGGKRRADLARGHRGGEIPRRDQHGDAGRLVVHQDARARRRRDRILADIAHAPPRRTSGRTPRHRRPRRANPTSALPFSMVISFARRSCVAHDQLEGFAQDLAALARLLGGPAGKGGGGGVERRLGVVDRAAGDRGDLVLGGRIDHVEAAAVGGFAPFAADPKVGRNVGEKIVVHGVVSFTLLFRPGRAEINSVTTSAPARRCDRRSAARGPRECRRPAAECAAW